MSRAGGLPLNLVLDRCVLSADEAVALIVQVLHSVTELHRAQSFHGEIKASNVVLHKTGTIELKPSQSTVTGVSVPGDLYAVGSLFFEMMTGLTLGLKPTVPPRPIQYPIEALHWIPIPVRDVIAKLCSPLPDKCYPTAEAALQAVQGLAIVSVDSDDVGALAREIENLAEVQLMLSRSATKTIAKRALARAVAMQSRITTQDRPLVISHDIVDSALLQVRGERAVQLQTDSAPMRYAPIRAVPVRRGIPWMELGFVILVIAGIGLIFGPRLNLSEYSLNILSSKPAPQVAAAKPTVIPMPNNQATNPKVFWLHRHEGPRLSWANNVDGFDVFLHVSRSANFAARVVDVTVRGNEHKINKELDEGRYFWRLWDRQSQKSVGPFEFTLSHLEAPKVLTPVDQQSLTIAPTYTTVVLDVSWACKPSARQYEVEIVDGTGAKSSKKSTDQCMLNSEQLSRGQYTLRVRVSEPIGEMNAWSEPVVFWVNGGPNNSLSKFRQENQRRPAQTFKKSK